MTSALTLNQYLMVSGLLFALGLAGLVLRRNALVIFMALEMNLNAANLALVAFSKFNKIVDGQVFVFSSSPSPRRKWRSDWRSSWRCTAANKP